MIRLGLFLYDRLGGATTLPKSQGIAAAAHALRRRPEAGIRKGYIYSDAWVDDARLVLLNLRSARRAWREHPAAHPLYRRRAARRPLACTAGRPPHAAARTRSAPACWSMPAGPWVSQVAGTLGKARTRPEVRLVKGSHIVVPKLFEGEHAYIVQDSGKRIIFMIPYEQDFTLIGTTDVVVDAIGDGAAISAEEIDYLCTSVSRYTRRPVTPDMVVWSYSGIRPLYDNGVDDPSAVTRDYTLVLDDGGQERAATVHLRRQDHDLPQAGRSRAGQAGPWLGAPAGKWTGGEPLPGGDLGAAARPDSWHAWRNAIRACRHRCSRA